ncbi:MAG TPA: B-box zinc finger protein [Myxococcaceae bacterium]|nr:B-box zinc finger protein [Myxococcaceae bacterium]
MALPSSAACPEHPRELAAWRCLACGRLLCPECAEQVEMERGLAVVGCRHCHGGAQPLRVSGREETFRQSLRGLLRMPVSAFGFAGLWVLAVTEGTVARSAGAWSLLLWSAPMWVAGIALVRATAERSATLGASVAVSVVKEILLPAARGLVLTAPLILWAAALGSSGRALLALGTGFGAPLVLGRIASGASVAGTVDPRWYARAWSELPSDSLLAGACSALVLGFSRMLWDSAGLDDANVPRLWVDAAATLGAFSMFLLPQIAGLLVRAHAETLGFELRSRGERLARPGAVPRHGRALGGPPEPPPTSPRRYEPIEIEDTGRGSEIVLEPLAGGSEPDDTP